MNARVQSVYVGQDKLLMFRGQYFADTPEAADAIRNVQWANHILKQPATTFQNGRDSHEVAGEELEKAEDTLLDYMRLVVS